MSLIKDLQTLTTIPEKSINEFFKKVVYCTCNEVQEEILDENREDKEILKIDIAIGQLYVKDTTEGLKYKFVPCEYFKKNLEATIKQGKNPLRYVLSKTLVKKFLETYKNLC